MSVDVERLSNLARLHITGTHRRRSQLEQRTVLHRQRAPQVIGDQAVGDRGHDLGLATIELDQAGFWGRGSLTPGRGLRRSHSDPQGKSGDDRDDSGDHDARAASPAGRLLCPDRRESHEGVGRIDRLGCGFAADRANGHQPPRAGDALQLMRCDVVELDRRAMDQILDGAGHQDLCRPGERHHARPDMNRNATEVSLDGLDLARVQPHSNVDPQLLHARGDRDARGDRLRRLREGRQEPISREVRLVPAVMSKRRADDLAEAGEQRGPARVPEVGGHSVDPTMSRKRTVASRRPGAEGLMRLSSAHPSDQATPLRCR